MKIVKTRAHTLLLLIVVAAAAAMVATTVFASAPPGTNPGGAEVVDVFGKIPGKDLYVHLWVIVPPGTDRNQVAHDALGRQGARPLDHSEFLTTGLRWNQFSDSKSNNDFVTQNYNPAGDPTEGGIGGAALLNTHATWSAVPSSSFAFSYGGTTNRCPSLVLECGGSQSFDGKNDVAWVDLGGCCTLGITWYGLRTNEADIAINPGFNWESDGVSNYDIETVILHENGHVAGLFHSDVAESVMLAFYQGVERDLHQDDIDGISSLYPSAGDNPPAVSITSPQDGSSVTGIVTVSASASDDQGIAQVEFFVNGASVGVDDSAPYSASWDAGTAVDGSHTVTATARDTIGQTDTDSIGVVVDNVDDPPALSITEPTSEGTLTGMATVSANASDDRGILQVEFFVDGVSIGMDSITPYSVLWDTTAMADGGHIITATATDTIGQTTDVAMDVTVDNTVPSLAVSSIDYATSGGKKRDKHLLITAALDSAINGALVSIEIFHNGSLYNSVTGTTNSNGTVTFRESNAPAGCYTSVVTDVTAPGLAWEGTTLANGLCK